ncbi:hypothetical protein KSS87_021601 [Heliosperma pusillum]|nr:hypothetical protein KSS87_021601 [Heliosperma pusillum]
MTEGRYTYKDDEPKNIFREVEQVTMEKTHGDEFHSIFLRKSSGNNEGVPIPDVYDDDDASVFQADAFDMLLTVYVALVSESEVEASKEGRRLADFSSLWIKARQFIRPPLMLIPGKV